MKTKLLILISFFCLSNLFSQSTEVLVNKTFGTAYWDIGKSICTTTDDGFLVGTGSMQESSSSFFNGKIYKFKSDLSIDWEKTIAVGEANATVDIKKVIKYDGDNFLIAYNVEREDPYITDKATIHLQKVDKDGVEIWN